MRAVQIFTAKPTFYGDKSGISPKRVERFHAALEETGIKPEHVVVHAAYELTRRGHGRAAVALCGGGGQGDALLLER